MIQKCVNSQCGYWALDEPDGCDKPLKRIYECDNATLVDVRDKKFYIKGLEGNVCVCGRPKRRGNSFCYQDYSALPDTLQRFLYKPFGTAYMNAFDAAENWLREQRE